MKSNTLHISLTNISKRFLAEWIFRDVNLEISSGEKIVILGPNGSGKSTLLQAVSSYQIATKGKLVYKENDKILEEENIFERMTITAPYLELIEDYSLRESIEHQAIFKPFLPGLNTEKIIEISGLGKKNADKPIRLYSSGMKQRAKLTLAVLADCPLLLLDEPCSNFDRNAVNWYDQLIADYAMHKTIIVCSNNVREEFSFCTRELNIENYKPAEKLN